MGAALAPVAAIAGLGGGLLSGLGAYSSMEAQSANAAFQAQVAANNAQIAKQNFGLQIQSGEEAVSNDEMKLRTQLGTIKAGQAASGVDVNSGSFVSARTGAAETGTLDALTMRSNNARQAYGYEVQATSDTAESELLTAQSQQAAAAAPLAGIGSLLSSTSTVGGNFAKYLNTIPGS
jgi:hypothetical protein